MLRVWELICIRGTNVGGHCWDGIDYPEPTWLSFLDAPNINWCIRFDRLMKKNYFISIKLILIFYHHIFFQPEIYILTYSHTWSSVKVFLATKTNNFPNISIYIHEKTFRDTNPLFIELFDFPNPIFKSVFYFFKFFLFGPWLKITVKLFCMIYFIQEKLYKMVDLYL